MSELLRREFCEALLDADTLRGSARKVAGGDREAEWNRPKLGLVSDA
jgi:hypothetical protein